MGLRLRMSIADILQLTPFIWGFLLYLPYEKTIFYVDTRHRFDEQRTRTKGLGYL